MMGSNIPSGNAALREETTALRGDNARLPRLVATDEEGGTVKRLPGDSSASALTLKNQPVAATSKAFADRSALVQSAGITLNFGIIADTTANTKSFIYDRVLGITPNAAANRVTAAVRASKDMTLTTLKHFPGHGETAEDSHQVIPSIALPYDAWLNKDAVPFIAGIGAGADVVMMGHLRYSAVDTVPASVSKKWHDILRNTLKFKGVTITDAMGMLQASGDSAYTNAVHNAVLALQAGNTMLLYATEPAQDPASLIDGIEAAVGKGDLNESLITQDARAALELRAQSAAFIR
jgi:beta-N-acetylhexosaminidase